MSEQAPEPESTPSQFQCIGCGTMNPAGAEVCAGCGHPFAGPGGGVSHESITEMANRLAASQREYQPEPIPREMPAVLGCLINLVMLFLSGVAVLVAFVVAVSVSCSILPQNETYILPALAVGLFASVAVIVLIFWIRSVVQSRR